MIGKEIAQGACSGCHACYSICPKNAIKMQSNGEGFLYPCVDTASCIDCGLCKKVCPINSEKPAFSKVDAFAVVNQDDITRAQSSSGGVFALLANQIILSGGVIYGAGFNEAFAVNHMRVESDIRPLQVSKYVQSRIGDSFRCVEDDLLNGRYVLFSGTPCQVAGLYQYLSARHIDCNKLYLIDLICHGVPSPTVWEKYLSFVSAGKTVKNINFRDKSISWGGFSLNVAFQDGSCYQKPANQDPYMKAFFANLTLRPSCYNCAQKTINRFSDLTLADCWGIENIAPEMNDGKGVSAVVVHSEKGRTLLQQIANQTRMKEIQPEQVFRHNKVVCESVTPHPRRSRFFKLLRATENMNIVAAVDQVLKPTLGDRARDVSVQAKRFVKKLFKTHL